MTLRHLVSSRAGFTHEAPIGNNNDPSFPSFEAHVDSISQTWLRFPVGERFRYSNLGFDLARYILQTVTRKPFAKCLKTMLFDPLGMNDTTADTDGYAQRANRALGHREATDDTTKALPGKPEQVLGQLMEAQRAKLLQAHAIMTCVREVLLYAEGDDAVIYAEAANAAAVIASDAAEELDSVRLKPMFDALRLERTCRPAAEQGLSPGVDDGSSV